MIRTVNRFAPLLLDFALGWTAPFLEGIQRARKENTENTEKKTRN